MASRRPSTVPKRLSTLPKRSSISVKRFSTLVKRFSTVVRRPSTVVKRVSTLVKRVSTLVRRVSMLPSWISTAPSRVSTERNRTSNPRRSSRSSPMSALNSVRRSVSSWSMRVSISVRRASCPASRRSMSARTSTRRLEKPVCVMAPTATTTVRMAIVWPFSQVGSLVFMFGSWVMQCLRKRCKAGDLASSTERILADRTPLGVGKGRLGAVRTGLRQGGGIPVASPMGAWEAVRLRQPTPREDCLPGLWRQPCGRTCARIPFPLLVPRWPC